MNRHGFKSWFHVSPICDIGPVLTFWNLSFSIYKKGNKHNGMYCSCEIMKLSIHRYDTIASQVGQWQRIHLPVWEVQETWVQSLGQGDPLEEEMATHSSLLAWKVPWTEEPGGLQPTESQGVGHN